VLVGAALGVAAPALGVAAPAQAKPAPARLLVEAREFNLTLSRAKVKPGTAIIQMVNRGQDPHDLAIQRIGGKRRGKIDKLRPGELGSWDGRLRRGRYKLFCTIEGHRALGMRATLRVR
jgi:uncharacterized cupredoxin-like copper-binding protein